MTSIRYDEVRKEYPGQKIPAVDCISLDLPPESFVVILGPSGCGKTTLLKMTNRLVEPTSGTIYLDNIDIRTMEVTALRRRMGYVIQQVGLFPHLTVAENIAVVPELLGWEKKRTDQRIDDLLKLVQIPVDFRSRYPAQLSGGQQQRVGLARALAADPAVLLMDEPFGAIDAITRTGLQDEVLHIQRTLNRLILFVTHDVDEALRLADMIIVMDKGRVVQAGDPCELLMKPANAFVRALLNTDDRVRQLGLMTLDHVMEPLADGIIPDFSPKTSLDMTRDADARQALSLLLQPEMDRVYIFRDGKPVGQVTMHGLQRAVALPCDDDKKE